MVKRTARCAPLEPSLETEVRDLLFPAIAGLFMVGIFAVPFLPIVLDLRPRVPIEIDPYVAASVDRQICEELVDEAAWGTPDHSTTFDIYSNAAQHCIKLGYDLGQER